jgi:hypothetical protein
MAYLTITTRYINPSYYITGTGGTYGYSISNTGTSVTNTNIITDASTLGVTRFDALLDVSIVNLLDKQVAIYDTSIALWKNIHTVDISTIIDDIIIMLDVSFGYYATNASVNDAFISTNASFGYYATNSSINSAINYIETSLNWLNTNKQPMGNYIKDASARNGLYWNSGYLDVSVDTGSGVTSLLQLTDVSIDNLDDRHLIIYDEADSVWRNISSFDVSLNDYALSYNIKSLQSRFIIGASGNFRDISTAIVFANSSNRPIEFLLDSSTYHIHNTIDISSLYPITFRGITSSHTIIEPIGLSAKPLFNVYSELFIANLTLNGQIGTYGTNALDNCFNLIEVPYFEIQNSIITGFYNQINLTKENEIFIFNSVFEDASNASILVNSSTNTIIDVEVNTFHNCKNMIYLKSSNYGKFDLINNIFDCSTGHICILYDSTTYLMNTYNSVIGNRWDNYGTFKSGFDFSRTDARDAKVYSENNAGVESKRPHTKYNVIGNASTNVIATGGTYQKVNFDLSTTNYYTCKWTVQNNRIIYQPSNKKDIKVWCSGSGNNANNRPFSLCFRKDGSTTNISPITVRGAAGGADTSFSMISYIENIEQNSYIELFVTAPNTNDVVTITDMTLFAEAM